MSIGAGEAGFLVVWLLAIVVQFGVAVYAIVDVAKRSEAAFSAAGQNKTLWLILNIVGLFTCFVLPVVYLAAIRPKVASSGA